jgi:hypothetical protein
LKFDEAMDALHGGSVDGVHPKTRWQFHADALVSGPALSETRHKGKADGKIIK